MATKTAPSQHTTAARKRSIARRFNDALTGRTTQSASVDQRTARKLARYRNELKSGSGARNTKLSSLDVVRRVHELLDHGERLSAIRKLSKPRRFEYDEETMIALLVEMQPVYRFRAEAYQHAGIRDETLVAAGVLEEVPKKRGPRKRK